MTTENNEKSGKYEYNIHRIGGETHLKTTADGIHIDKNIAILYLGGRNYHARRIVGVYNLENIIGIRQL